MTTSLELEVPGHHYTMCAWCVVSPVGTDGRPPAHMGWSENRDRDSERVATYWILQSILMLVKLHYHMVNVYKWTN